MSPALFVLAALVATPEGADAPIAYQVKVLEMEGLGWRSAHAERLRRIERPGVGAIWTGTGDAGKALVKATGRVISEAKVAARPEATAELVRGQTGPVEVFLAGLTGHAIALLGAQPIPGGGLGGPDSQEAIHVEVTGRKLDQGTLARVEIENTWVSAWHQLPVPESDAETLACNAFPGNAGLNKVYFVPEVAHARVSGEWLIPGDGILVVSLGAHSSPTAEGKVIVRERLAVIEVVPADVKATADVCPAEGPVARPASLPPLPEDIDLSPAEDAACRVAEAKGGKPADAKKDDTAPPAEEAPKATKVPEKVGHLPMPTPPGRSLPQGFTPDGSPAPPTKQDEEVKPTAGEGSAEPRPTPQATPQAAPSARATPAAEGPDRDVPFETLSNASWSLTLPEAIRVGLMNCAAPATFRVVHPGDATQPASMVIAPGPGAEPFQFQAEVMAMVRSVEQQYWALSQQETRIWSDEVALELASEALRRVRAKGEAEGPTVADAENTLELLRRDHASATADVRILESQLRRILNLKPTDGRHILTTSAPIEARVEPIWDDCVATMEANQPDILLRKTRAQAPGGEPTAADRRADLDHVVHKTTLALARFFLAVTGNYHEFQAAHRLREAAMERLETQQAAFEVGDLPIDHYVTAIQDWSTAMSREAESKSTYNTAIIALEEAQGTLLVRKGIVVAEAGPASGKVEPEVKRASLESETSAPAPRSFGWNIPLDGTRSVSIRVSTTRSRRALASPAK